MLSGVPFQFGPERSWKERVPHRTGDLADLNREVSGKGPLHGLDRVDVTPLVFIDTGDRLGQPERWSGGRGLQLFDGKIVKRGIGQQLRSLRAQIVGRDFPVLRWRRWRWQFVEHGWVRGFLGSERGQTLATQVRVIVVTKVFRKLLIVSACNRLFA